MKTADQIKAEIEALKGLLQTNPDQADLIYAVMGELEWVTDDQPEAMSVSQMLVSANSLVKE